ncbi:MAG: ribonuclease T [Methylotetracoccus sp.]
MSADSASVREAISGRFRKFLPVVVDIETSGFDPRRHAVLEIAAVIPCTDSDERWRIAEVHDVHVKPFDGAELDPEALAFNRIDPLHPFRDARDEMAALDMIFAPIHEAVRRSGCSRAVLVAHNAAFDLAFLNAAVRRNAYRNNPFHAFTSFDTATLSALMFGQTVLAKAVRSAGLSWDNRAAHAARYDAERTAELFCWMLNRWSDLTAAEQPRPRRVAAAQGD